MGFHDIRWSAAPSASSVPSDAMARGWSGSTSRSRNAHSALDRARAAGLPVAGGAVQICGVVGAAGWRSSVRRTAARHAAWNDLARRRANYKAFIVRRRGGAVASTVPMRTGLWGALAGSEGKSWAAADCSDVTFRLRRRRTPGDPIMPSLRHRQAHPHLSERAVKALDAVSAQHPQRPLRPAGPNGAGKSDADAHGGERCRRPPSRPDPFPAAIDVIAEPQKAAAHAGLPAAGFRASTRASRPTTWLDTWRC